MNVTEVLRRTADRLDPPDSAPPPADARAARRGGRWPRALADLLRTHESDPPEPLDAAPAPAERSRPARHRSLYTEILDFMFAPLALLWPLSLAITFIVARSLADVPFDRALDERLRSLTNYVVITQSFNPSPSLLSPDALRDTPLTDPPLYQVATGQGILLGGTPSLPHGADVSQFAEQTIRHRTVTIDGREWRIARAWLPRLDGPAGKHGPLLIQVGETLERRNALANDIISGIIVPQFLILPLAVFLVWFGLTRGLQPLSEIQRQLRRRNPGDFSSIDTRGTPDELAPLVGAFNDLLRRLEETHETQRRFIGDAAHQLKTPLAGLRTQAELALQHPDPADVRQSLRHIARSADRSARMVSQLLSLARMENQRDHPLHQQIDLCTTAREVVTEWVPRSLEMGCDLGFEGMPSAHYVSGDPLLLEELLNNLIDNALRYGGTDGNVTVRVRPDADALLLEVEDNGPGIDPEEQVRIFDRFYRVLGNRTEGSGLGLAIVREIAHNHQGHVQVTSPASPHAADRPGTRFTIRFPAIAPARLPAPSAEPKGASD